MSMRYIDTEVLRQGYCENGEGIALCKITQEGCADIYELQWSRGVFSVKDEQSYHIDMLEARFDAETTVH